MPRPLRNARPHGTPAQDYALKDAEWRRGAAERERTEQEAHAAEARAEQQARPPPAPVDAQGGAFVLLVHDGKALLVKGRDRLGLLGGDPEPTEAPAETAARAVQRVRAPRPAPDPRSCPPAPQAVPDIAADVLNRVHAASFEACGAMRVAKVAVGGSVRAGRHTEWVSVSDLAGWG